MNKTELGTRFRDNISRVRNLAEIYESKITSAGSGRRPVGSADVLRAAVVLLHATLEDFVRTISRELLPNQNESVLDKVPLSGTAEHGRAEKFLLGKLVPFRGKTVNEVLSKSVADFLEHSNYNNPEELAAAIENVGLDKKKIEHLFVDLRKMMERRHVIVHRADRNPQSGKGYHKGQSLGAGHVNGWIDTVENFANEILKQLP